MPETIVISVGGSLIVPDHIDTAFLKSFRNLVLKQVKKGRRFVIIAGGGRTAREYQKAASEVTKLTPEQLDFIGIQSTFLNATLLHSLFGKTAYKEVIMNPTKKINFKRILIASGWKPGCSTDTDAVLLAKNFKVKRLINLTNVEYVYDKDPKYKSAKPIKQITWKAFRKILPSKWSPGLNVPLDPIAAKKAEQFGLEVAIIKGIANLEKYIEGKPFRGTRVRKSF